jgi:RND family efflux transporter MFP subunit
VALHADASDGGDLRGKVLRIGPVVDPATSTVKVTLSVVNSDARVRPGSFVRAKITTDVHENVVCIPRKALVAEAGADYVFVAEADTVRKVTVDTGYADEQQIEILDGIGADARVVTVGQGGLRTGSRIVEVDSEGQTVGRDENPTDIAQAN